MQKTLSPGAIGIKGVSLAETIDLAKASGFDSIVVDIREADQLAQDGGIAAVKALFDDSGILPGYWSLPVAWRDPEKAPADIELLSRRIDVALALDCPRAASGIMPGINDKTFDEQFASDVEHFRPVAQILADAGIRIAMEFIGPKTLRNRFTTEYIFDLPGMMNFARTVGTGNIGLTLDVWHLYTSYGTLADVEKLNADDVVVAHVNDAPPGIDVDEQEDLVRALPLETGVLDVVGFMHVLQRIGFDGPVMPEPFSARINTLAETDPLAAARETGASMDALWKAAAL